MTVLMIAARDCVGRLFDCIGRSDASADMSAEERRSVTLQVLAFVVVGTVIAFLSEQL